MAPERLRGRADSGVGRGDKWAGLRAVCGRPHEGRGRISGACLAVSGSTPVRGSRSTAHGGPPAEVRAWGLGEPDLQQALARPAGSDAGALAAAD
jgi:hypothetical protein